MMSPYFILCIILVYFVGIYIVSHVTARKADNSTFFIGNRKSPWFIVAFGMIGASISGVSFISVPGWVGTSQFSYMQIVLGYLAGYAFIALVLMPLYYKLELTSIYTYLQKRFGETSYISGAMFFLISRTIGSAFRLFLSVSVLQYVVFDHMGVPFWLTASCALLFVYYYTRIGGVRTIIYTDTIQTAFMLFSLIGVVVILARFLHLDFAGVFNAIRDSNYSKVFFWTEYSDKRFFFRQFLSGAFIAITMTGLDQDLMQKNLSCKNIREAQKNMFWFSLSLIPVNILFLVVGAMLYIFAAQTGFVIPANSDMLFPAVATLDVMPVFFVIIFTIGLISATFASSDSAITALTTSFTLDILKANQKSDEYLAKTRKRVHLAISLLIIGLIMLFHVVNNQNVISAVFTAAGYTYGPLLGLFSFGLFTKYKLKEKLVPYVTIASPVVCLFLNFLFPDFFSFEILIINGMLTFMGLFVIRKKQIPENAN
ncbi:MAG TPA: sodium:solute symporter [Bacteroidales bacterium]|nr:sodium:solute symporter [Bacteroidales bacterium]